MNENLNLTEILKDCPKGTELYSPLCGVCKLDHVNYDLDYVDYDTYDGTYPLCVVSQKSGLIFYFKSNGKYINEGECLLFPSKDQRDWNEFNDSINKHFDPKTLKPFQQVIAWAEGMWVTDFFSFLDEDNVAICTGGNEYRQVVPYNDDTKHLVGTTQKAPKYYQWWNDFD